MAYHLHVDKNNPLPEPTHVWGIGRIIGDRQKTIVQDSDYDDLEEVLEAVRASFELWAHEEERP